MKKIYDENGKVFAELNYSENYYLDYNKHSHESLAFSVFSSGNLEVLFHNKKQIEVQNKQVIVYNPHQVHMTKSKRKNVKNYFSLHIDSSWYKNIQKEFFHSHADTLYLENLLKDESIYNSLYKFCEEFYVFNTYDLESLKDLLKKIIKKYSFQEEQINEEPKFLLEVERFIENNIEEPISLEDIAKAVCYDESYITRVFKKKYGLTPHAYLLNKRVQKAKTKLIDSKDISLAELSSEVGFYDQNHFSKVFKKVFAITPNSYRKS